VAGGSGISGTAVAAATAGGFLIFIGIKNVRVQDGLRQILAGQSITEGPQTTYRSESATYAAPPLPSEVTTVTLGTGGRSVEKLTAIVRSSGYNVTVTSAERPGATTESGNPSYHADGRAIDVAGPDMGKLAQWLYDLYRGRLLELIYSGPPAAVYVKNGQPSGPYAVADHLAHVHVAANGDAL
jgi:hypothetical protein